MRVNFIANLIRALPVWRWANGRAVRLGDIAVAKFGTAVANSKRDDTLRSTYLTVFGDRRA